MKISISMTSLKRKEALNNLHYYLASGHTLICQNLLFGECQETNHWIEELTAWIKNVRKMTMLKKNKRLDKETFVKLFIEDWFTATTTKMWKNEFKDLRDSYPKHRIRYEISVIDELLLSLKERTKEFMSKVWEIEGFSNRELAVSFIEELNSL